MSRNTTRLLAAGIAAALCSAAAPASALEEIRMTIPSFAAVYAPIMIAREKGYYKEEGLDVKLVKAGGGTATPALISGTVQFTGSPSSAITAILRGAPLRLALISQDRPPYQIWASDPKIKTLKDLRGRQVGIISRGDTHEISVILALRTIGIKRSEVGFTAFGFGRGRIAALLSGSAGVVSLGSVEVAELIANKAPVHLVYDTNGKIKAPTGGIGTSLAQIKDHPKRTKGFLKATLKGMRYYKAFKDGTIAINRKYDTKSPMKALVLSYDSVLKDQTDNGMVPVNLQTQEVELRAELMKLPKSKVLPANQVFDFSLTRQAVSELNASGWKPTK